MIEKINNPVTKPAKRNLCRVGTIAKSPLRDDAMPQLIHFI